MKKVTLITPLEQRLQLDLVSGTMLMPRYGAVSVATAIRDAGYEIKFFCEISGSKIDWDFIKESDFVCFSLMSFNSLHGYELTEKVREINSCPIIYGGSHPTVLPHESLEHADYVVINEGEETIVELFRALEEQGDPDQVNGIAYKKNGNIAFTPARKFIDDLHWPSDFSLIENYRDYSLLRQLFGLLPFIRGKTHVPVIQATRGCPRSCSFCFGKRELGNKYRKRKIDAVVTEVKNLLPLFKLHEMMIIDNDFCIDKKFTIKLLTEINNNELTSKALFWMFTRIETSRDKEFLQKIKTLGVSTVMLGVESVNDATLHFYNKKQNKEQITEAVKSFTNAGIDVMSFFVLGADTDSKESIRETLDFAIHEAGFLLSCFFALYDFPHQTKRFGEVQVIEDNRFIHHDWRLFNGNFVIHYPKNIKPSTLQKEIIRCYKKFYNSPKVLKDTFRGYQVVLSYRMGASGLLKSMKKYVKVLQKMEKELYTEDEKLIEERLPSADAARKTYIHI